MVSVREEDRNALRFLWVDDVRKSSPVIEEMRFARVVLGVSASPFLLNATINHHLERYRDRYSKLVDTLLHSMYVDDVTCGANSEDAAYQLYDISTKLFAEGGFNLRKFVTNSASLQQRISTNNQNPSCPKPASSSVVEENTTYTSTLFNNEMPNRQKISGVSWDPGSDTLEFDIRTIANSLQVLHPTKRNIVSFASRFYDPLGYLSPVIITLKIFFQELCKSKLNWDEPLPSQLLRKWKSLVSKFQGIVISVPRCHFHSIDTSEDCVLYGFCDASTSAYAAVVYLYNGSDSVQFVTSKTRVAPLTQQTIPRLELLARLMAHVIVALQSVINLCFTDSKVALYWIQGEGKEWKQFVHNRVTEIRQLVPAANWSHCPGRDNPADIPSCGVSPKELEMSLLWKHGPDWLRSIPSVRRSEETIMPEECVDEMKVKVMPSHSLLISTESCGIGTVVDCGRFSKLQKLLRVTVEVVKSNSICEEVCADL